MVLDWRNFFQLSTNDTFDIIEEDILIEGGTDIRIGNGKVQDISREKLVLEINIPSRTLNILGNSVDVPNITAMISITLLDEGLGNRLEAAGRFTNSDGVTENFSATDPALRAKLRNSGNRIRLDASDGFLRGISDNREIDRLGRVEFEKTGSPNTTEIDVGKLQIPFNNKIDIFLERNG